MSLTSILFNIGAKKSDRKRDAQIPYPAGVQQWNDISYGPHGKENLLDVYRPVGAGKCPIIVNVHGGGYVYGDKELYKRYCMDLARRGFAVVNFNYRLAPRWKFPAPLEDLNNVMHWISKDLEGQDMPKPPEYLSATQKDGSTLCAGEVYKRVWKWLADRGCATIVSPDLIERYSMCIARWLQCESVTSELGFLAKHPTTGQAIQSPYVAIANTYMNQANKLWGEIFQLVRENCTGEYAGGISEDPMAQLLRSRKGK